MRKLAEELRFFISNRVFVIALSLTAAAGYGFLLFHPTVGIDDTAVELYIVDGLEVVMGRWTIFLLNKVLRLSEFGPLVTDLAGILLLMLSAALFCILLKRGLGIREPNIPGYTIFACVFISNPIISEVFIYYYHDGVGLGYVLSALSLLLFQDALACRGRRRAGRYLGSLLLIWAAVGCYESFLILYILGVLVVVFLRGLREPDTLRLKNLSAEVGAGALLTVGVVVLRSIMIPVMVFVFRLQDAQGILELRSLSEMSALLTQGEGLETFMMLVKRFWVVYHVNALVYLPVTVYELAVWIVGAIALVCMIRRRKLWYGLLYIGMLIAPFLLTLVEAQVTLYRSCQYLPFFAALGVFLGYHYLGKCKYRKVLQGICLLGGGILIFNQASALNQSFYTDYRKYENTRQIMSRIAYEVEKNYGTELPVIFTGDYDEPYELIQDYYVPYGSRKYQWIARITDVVDEHLKEKYFTPWGYSFIGEAQYPFLKWGLDAFDGTNREIIRFLEMHGYSFQTVSDPEVLERAREAGETMPCWPLEGSIRMQDGYVLIHL